MVRWLVLVAVMGVSAETPAAEWSEPSPLAAQSLVLDAVRLDDRVVAVGERGHVLLSDGRHGWRQARVQTRALLTAVTAAGGQAWAVGHDATIVHSTDGAGWSLQYEDPEAEAPLLDVWFENGHHGIAVGAYGSFLETSDGGATWTARTVSDDDPHYYAIAEGPHGKLYLAGEFGTIMRSDDRGATWERLETPYEGTFFGITPLRDATLLVYGLRGHVFRSDDRGVSWDRVVVATDAGLLRGTELTDGRIVLVGLSGAVLWSDDGGRSFDVAVDAERLGIAGVIQTDSLLAFGEFGIRAIDSP